MIPFRLQLSEIIVPSVWILAHTIRYGVSSTFLFCRKSPGYQGSSRESLSPDNDIFVYLAKLYAENHKTMTLTEFQCSGDGFPDGITNGAFWYNVRGKLTMTMK